MIIQDSIHIAKSKPVSIGQGFRAAHFNSDMFDRRTGPVLMVDDFRMSVPTFPPHPHAGISAVTYVLPDSPGAHVSFDSLGQVVTIDPGSLHWFCAGNGAVHTEEPEYAPVHGLQIFVNLPIRAKRCAPHAQHLKSRDVPIVINDELIVRVVVGSFGGKTSPLEPPTPMMLLDFHSLKRVDTNVPLPSNWAGMVYVLNGQLIATWQSEVAEVTAGSAIGFESNGNSLQVQADVDTHWVLIFGETFQEPYCTGGPIIMESDQANQERYAAYHRGEFGTIPT